MKLTIDHFRLAGEPQIKNIFHSLKELGFSYASFGFNDLRTKKVTGCFSHEGWGNTYVLNRLFVDDPLFQTARRIANHQILWSAVSIDSAEGYEVMMQRAAVSGARSGITLAINDGSVQEIIAIGDDDKESIFLSRFIKDFTKIMDARKIIKNLAVENP